MLQIDLLNVPITKDGVLNANAKCFLLGIAGFFLGSAIYLLRKLNYAQYDFLALNVFLGNGPTFFHTFAFSLLLSSLFFKDIKAIIAIPVLWFLVNTFMEFEQNNNYDLLLPQYFYSGWFDPLDVFASGLGAAAALTVILLLRK